MILSLRPSQVLCCICLQQKLVKFPLQLWRYRCVTETWLLWAAAMWSSNGANDVCSSFNFAAACASLWLKQASKKANNIIRLAWISTTLNGRMKGIRGRLISPSMPVGYDWCLNLNSQKQPRGRNIGEHRLVRRSITISRGTVVLVFCLHIRSFPRTDVPTIFMARNICVGQLKT